VRRAYHHLARQHHPDISNAPDSTNRMQAINEAYQRIMEQFEKDA
jgi:curved DNA-binding protein